MISFFTLQCELFTSCNVSNNASLVSARTGGVGWSTKCGQAWTGGGGGPKNSQICADILHGDPIGNVNQIQIFVIAAFSFCHTYT